MDTSLIRMFNKALKGNDCNYEQLIRESAAAGYIVHPDCATKDVMEFLLEEKTNPNSTFYKTWQDVTSRSKEQIFIEQSMHYATTYGNANRNINPVEIYTENENPIVIDFTSYKYIMPATPEEIFNDCMSLLQSGIALNTLTILAIERFISENDFIDKVDIDTVKNKEAKCILACHLDKVPNNEFDILRSIVYCYTNSATIIKDSTTLFHLRNPHIQYDFSRLTNEQLKSLSKIFYRFKPLFLAIRKGNDSSKQYINKIRRYARKYHKPFVKGFWEDCLSLNGRDAETNLNYAKKNVENITNFKKVQLMQTIKSRLIDNSNEHFYIIRNGKQFVKKGKQYNIDKDYLNSLYDILKSSIIDSLKKKATTYYIPDNVHITMPTSEKNFIGNYPMGSNVDLFESNNVVGIYWRNEWGTRDYDIHCYDSENNDIGWNGSYVQKDVIYSGDMTYADPEAAELLYFNGNINQTYMILVNKYNGDLQSKFKLFIATENMYDKLPKSRTRIDDINQIMVDPNNIKFEAMIDMTEAFQMNVGFIKDNKFYFMASKSGDSRVTLFADNINKLMQHVNAVRADSYIDMEELLIEAGFTKSKTAELDLTNPSKDLLISLFS